jgi:hypothetical protein
VNNRMVPAREIWSTRRVSQGNGALCPNSPIGSPIPPLRVRYAFARLLTGALALLKKDIRKLLAIGGVR